MPHVRERDAVPAPAGCEGRHAGVLRAPRQEMRRTSGARGRVGAFRVVAARLDGRGEASCEPQVVGVKPDPLACRSTRSG